MKLRTTLAFLLILLILLFVFLRTSQAPSTQGPATPIPVSSHETLETTTKTSHAQPQPMSSTPAPLPTGTPTNHDELTEKPFAKEKNENTVTGALTAQALGKLLISDQVPSGKTLLSKSGPFQDPSIGDGQFDGSVLTRNAGFIFWLESKSYTRIEIDRPLYNSEIPKTRYCIKIRFERPGTHAWQSYSSEGGSLKARVLNGDPYQLLFKAGDEYLIQARWLRRGQSVSLGRYSSGAIVGSIYQKQKADFLPVGKFALIEGQFEAADSLPAAPPDLKAISRVLE